MSAAAAFVLTADEIPTVVIGILLVAVAAMGALALVAVRESQRGLKRAREHSEKVYDRLFSMRIRSIVDRQGKRPSYMPFLMYFAIFLTAAMAASAAWTQLDRTGTRSWVPVCGLMCCPESVAEPMR